MAGKAGLTKLSKRQFEVIDISEMKNSTKHNSMVTSDGRYALITYSGSNHLLYNVNSAGKFLPTGWSRSGDNPFFDKKKGLFYFKTSNTLEVLDPSKNKIVETIDFQNAGEIEFMTFYKDKIFTTSDAIVRMNASNGHLLKEWNFNDIDITISPRVLDQLTIKDDSTLYFHNSSEVVEMNIWSDIAHRIPLPSNNMGIMDVFVVDNDLWIPNKLNTLIKLKWDSLSSTYAVENIVESNHFENVGTCTMDDNGIIWLCTYNGLKSIDTRTGNMIVNIDGRDGLNTIDDKVCVTNNGTYLNTGDDIIKINEYYTSPQMGKMTVNELLIKGIVQPLKEKYKVTYGKNDLSIKWNLPYLGRYDQLSFYYTLVGHDQLWHYNENHNSVNYSNLPPGDYFFRLRATCLDKEKEETLFQLSISPPWWRTLWFYIISSFFVILFFFGLYRNRLQKATSKANLEKKMAQLEIKALRAQLNPHFIFNSLNSVKSLIQCDEKEQAIEYLVLFSTMMRRVLDMSDTESVSLREELDFSEEYVRMEALRLGNRFSYTLNIDEGLDLDFIQVPPMILQPHLENAIWHGIIPLSENAGHIKISIEDHKDNILIKLDDNGIGRRASSKINNINTKYKHRSKGTSLSIDRIKLSSAIREQKLGIDIIDKYERNISKGTTVIISILK